MTADAAAELYIGVMSGTSLDGIDVALVDFARTPPRLVAARTAPLAEHLRGDLLKLCSPGDDGLDRLGRCHVAVGDATADAVVELLRANVVEPAEVVAIGSHGQTVRHRPDASPPFSLQIGDASVIAERTGVTVVADFRSRDLAAGGQGAPLVPAFHDAVFRRTGIERVVVNIGGIANVTILPAEPDRPVTGFDTGPGNVLLDGWASRHLLAPFDRDGAWAAQARPDRALLRRLLEDPYFRRPAPKSTGREHFDLAWLERRLTGPVAPAMVQATLSELTAASIAHGILTTAAVRPDEVLVCGGGRHNGLVMQGLAERLAPCRVRKTEEVGLDGDWVEATAFAWLARQRLERRSGNVPAVTGARGPRILGAVYAGNA